MKRSTVHYYEKCSRCETILPDDELNLVCVGGEWVAWCDACLAEAAPWDEIIEKE